MSISKDQFRDITRAFLEGLPYEDTSEDTSRSLNEIQAEPNARQLTLNQEEVDVVLDMANAIEPMFFAWGKLRSMPQSYLDDGTYEKIEQILLDLPEDLRAIANDMKKVGI